MGHVDVNGVSYSLPDGRPLLDEVSFRVGEGTTTALVGPNGCGKTTLLRIVTGELSPHAGSVSRGGGLGVMPQFIGSVRDDTQVRDLLLAVSPEPLRAAANELDAAELAMMEDDSEAVQLRYAQALVDWADAGGYEIEPSWDVCTTSALGVPYEYARWRAVRTLSGGEQKRLVLEALLRGPHEVLLLDEPDNYLDIPATCWLEERLRETPKTVLLVSHDRELLARCADRIVTLEPRARGAAAWVHGGGFSTYAKAREERLARLEELRRRWDEEHAKLRELMIMYRTKAAYNDGMASRYQAALTRLRRFEEAGPPEAVPVPQRVSMRLRGGRTGKRVIVCERLALLGPGVVGNDPAGTDADPGDADERPGTADGRPGVADERRGTADGRPGVARGGSGTADADPGGADERGGRLTEPFDLEVWFGDRVAVLGSNGSGKSHFLRLLAAGGTEPEAEHLPAEGIDVPPVAHSGVVRLGSRVRPGWFAQTHEHPELVGVTLLAILHRGDGRRPGRAREEASRVLDRYGLAHCAEQTFDSLSGGQQARFQILLLELSGATLLLLDEPTDNLDLHSAEALENALDAFEGTVVAVTHDRWFARSFDRFLVFGADGTLSESAVPVWEVGG